MDEETITFRYRDDKDQSNAKFMKLGAMEFIRCLNLLHPFVQSL